VDFHNVLEIEDGRLSIWTPDVKMLSDGFADRPRARQILLEVEPPQASAAMLITAAGYVAQSLCPHDPNTRWRRPIPRQDNPGEALQVNS